jgi:hypothetical protein
MKILSAPNDGRVEGAEQGEAGQLGGTSKNGKGTDIFSKPPGDIPNFEY